MKIVFLCRRFYPQIGGVEKHVMEISKFLIKDGYDVTVITEASISDMRRKNKEREIINGVKVFRITVGKDDWFKKFRIWRGMWQCKKVILEADILHCHDVFFWYLPFRLLYFRKPVYTTFHGYESYPIRRGAIVMRKISEKLSWGNICIGDFIPKWYGTNPTIVSYGGVTVGTKHVKQKSKKYFGKYSAVFIGRLDEQTGALTYAKAVEILRKRYPKFNLTFVGDGVDRKKLEKKFKVLGFQKDPEKHLPQYHFAFVSRYLSILEAFAAKKMVFAVYDNPVKEDYLRMAPYAKWMVIEKDPEKLAKRVSYYLQYPEKQKSLVEKSYEWVKIRSWEEVVRKYLMLWRITP